jgi:type I restriction enzyme, S subunit
MSVPPLRFPEFSEPVQPKRLDEVAALARGKFSVRPRNDPRYFGGNTPFVQTGDVVNAERYLTSFTQTLNELGLEVSKIFPKNTILITIAANIGDVAITTFPVACPDSLVGINANENTSVGYLYEYLSTRKEELYSYATQNAQSNINLQVLAPLKIPSPTLPEQKKIAAFLGAVDAKIAALRANVSGLETYKRGLMQAMFSQRLRFSKPDGTAFPDWEERTLGQIAKRCKVKNVDFAHKRVLTNSAVQGVIDQGDYFDKDIANADNLGGYYIVKKGDFVYNPRISVTAPVGPIKRNEIGDGVMSPLYTVFRFNEADTAFFNIYFQTTFWHDYMKSVANYGARHDRMAISTTDFMDMPVPSPHPEEQTKIADTLSAMAAKIQAVTAQLTHMEIFKKGLLQQMFV